MIFPQKEKVSTPKNHQTDDVAYNEQNSQKFPAFIPVQAATETHFEDFNLINHPAGNGRQFKIDDDSEDVIGLSDLFEDNNISD